MRLLQPSIDAACGKLDRIAAGAERAVTPNATAAAGPGDAAPDDGAACWVAEESALLRGLNHSLSNRVAAVSALAGVLEADEAPGAQLTAALASESRRLETVLRLLRLLAGMPGAGTEPIQLGELLPEVALLHAQHADFREGEPATVTGAPDALPVVTTTMSLVRAVLALLSAARGAGARAALDYDGDERVVRLRVSPEPAAPLDPSLAERAAAAARWLLRGDEASVRVGDGGFVVELPTLLEIRRRRTRGG